VIPCFNESEVIGYTVAALLALANDLPELVVDMIIVDDGSQDDSRRILRELAGQDPRVRMLGLSRNFGHQKAVSAGLDWARGDAVVLIDADLQDPPELIPEMVTLWRQGYDVVYGQRLERQGESAFKRSSARLFYQLLNLLSDVPIPLDTGDFRLMDRRVVASLREMPERDRFLRGMVSWVGFRQIAIPYLRRQRLAGTSKYPLRKMVRFATDGILSFSTRPLQLSITLGFMSSLVSLLMIAYSILVRLFTSTWVEGWTSLMSAVLFLGGVQLIGIGILGEYTGRIYNEVKRRPLYFVAEAVGFDEETGPPS
jgi:dolichol-phosphate mannosyltransferase